MSELRNLSRRMGAQCKEDLRVEVCAGPMLERPASNGSLIPCMSTHTRIANTQKLFRDYPFLTAIDLAVVLDAWEMGFQFGVRQTEARCCGTAFSTVE